VQTLKDDTDVQLKTKDVIVSSFDVTLLHEILLTVCYFR